VYFQRYSCTKPKAQQLLGGKLTIPAETRTTDFYYSARFFFKFIILFPIFQMSASFENMQRF